MSKFTKRHMTTTPLQKVKLTSLDARSKNISTRTNDVAKTKKFAQDKCFIGLIKDLRQNHKVWSKKFETHNLLYCRMTIEFTKMNFKSADTLGIRLSEMVQYISVPLIVLEISKKCFKLIFSKLLILVFRCKILFILF